MPRPELPIDWKWVDEHLEAGCLGTDIAAKFAMHPNTLYRRIEEEYGIGFTEYAQQKRSCGDNLLRKAQFDKALKKDNTMLVWLGKQRLEQKENPQSNQFSPEAVAQFESFMLQIKQLQSAPKIDDTNSPKE